MFILFINEHSRFFVVYSCLELTIDIGEFLLGIFGLIVFFLGTKYIYIN